MLLIKCDIYQILQRKNILEKYQLNQFFCFKMNYLEACLSSDIDKHSEKGLCLDPKGGRTSF